MALSSYDLIAAIFGVYTNAMIISRFLLVRRIETISPRPLRMSYARHDYHRDELQTCVHFQTFRDRKVCCVVKPHDFKIVECYIFILLLWTPAWIHSTGAARIFELAEKKG
jgi:hypothetical protein